MKAGRILILYDNRTTRDTIIPGWGFSALIELSGRRILFDTGADNLVLEHNARILKVNLALTDALALSHEHCDHMGALYFALREGLEVYYPASFSSSFTERIGQAKAHGHPVSQAVEIIAGIHSTGELGTTVREQALVVEGKDGPILVTGCAHPGIVEVAQVATTVAGDPLQLILGGFHLLYTKDNEVQAIASDLKQIGVRRIAPCHCTGERAMELLKGAFGKAYLKVKAGSELKF